MAQDHDDEFDDETPAPRRLRIIPLTTTMLGLMLLVQLNEIYNDSLKLRSVYGVHEAQAADEKAAAPDAKIEGDKQKAQDSAATTTKDPATAGNDGTADKSADKSTDKTADKSPDKPADATAKTDAATAAPPVGDVKEGDAKKSDDAAKADAKPVDAKDAKTDEKNKDGKDAKPPEEPKTFGTGKSTVKQIEALKAKQEVPRFSQNEVDLLENLAKRRDELDKRERDLDIKAKVLDATDKRIGDKLVEMKTLEAQLSKVVAQYNEKQNTQIMSLVKIYENMKPQQAAAIFDQLDMPILLEVIDKMSQRKVAPVLAMMDPKKAKDVTEELAAMRKSDPKVPATAPAPAK